MSIRSSSLHRGLVRAGVAGLAVLAASGVSLPAASAAPATTIALNPASVELILHSTKNLGLLPVASPVPDDPFMTVPVGYGGSVTFTIPPQLSSPTPIPYVQLGLAPAAGSSVTRLYTSTATVPADRLTVTDLGSGKFQVDIPADDGTNGPSGHLAVTPLTSTVGAGAQFVDPAQFWLDLSGGGPASVDLPAQLVVNAGSPCGPCQADASVRAGSPFDVTLPVASLISASGIPDLSSSAFSFRTADQNWLAVGTATSLTGTLSSDARTVTLTLPPGTAGGRYELDVVLGDATAAVIAMAPVLLDVTAANPDVRSNTGLRSDTGVEGSDAAPAGGASALVPLGAAMVLVAGVGSVAVLRRRTSSQE